jgi:N-acetyl-gamma-glutamyl-phosphate reductase
MINIAVCGATGYTGLEIIRILLKHPKAAIKVLTAKLDNPKKISDEFPEFQGKLDLVCEDLVVDSIVKKKVDLVFLALPHKVSMQYASSFIDRGKTVIDLSADFRLKDTKVYEKYYGQKHIYKQYLSKSVYGLPELYKNRIKNARLLANPGCYPTGSILAVAPLVSAKLVSAKTTIVLDAKSGVTGAGRKADINLIFGEVAENLKAYKVGVHQHVPEIQQELDNISGKCTNILFTPHLVPIRRGILTTAYVPLKNKTGVSSIVKLYKSFYSKAPFVKVYEEGSLPQIQDVVYTNKCAIGVAVSPHKDMAIIVSAIDNLLKGASGQAVQNMNIIYGFPEDMGLA